MAAVIPLRVRHQHLAAGAQGDVVSATAGRVEMPNLLPRVDRHHRDLRVVGPEEVCAIRRKDHRPDGPATGLKAPHFHTRATVPQNHLAVRSCRGQHPAVRREGQIHNRTRMFRKLEQSFSRGRFPQTNHALSRGPDFSARRGQDLAIGGEHHVLQVEAFLRIEGPHQFLAYGIPDLDAASVTGHQHADGERFPIGRESGGARLPLDVQSPQALSVGGVPKKDDVFRSGHGGQKFAVGREGDGRDRHGMVQPPRSEPSECAGRARPCGRPRRAANPPAIPPVAGKPPCGPAPERWPESCPRRPAGCAARADIRSGPSARAA
jgi:hypothetical protein